MIRERRTIFRCICDRRRSRYRYRSRVSSGASSSGKMLNGSGSAPPRTSIRLDLDLDLAGLQLRVDVLRRPERDLPVDPEDRLLGVAAHLVRERGVGPDHELRDPVMVPQVEEEHAPQVPLVVEPARQSDHLTLVALPQFPAGMRSEFLHVDPFRDAEPLLRTSERAPRHRSRSCRSRRSRFQGCQSVSDSGPRPLRKARRGSTAGIPVPLSILAGRVGSPPREDRRPWAAPVASDRGHGRALREPWAGPRSGRFFHISRDGNTLAKRAVPRQDASLGGASDPFPLLSVEGSREGG